MLSAPTFVKAEASAINQSPLGEDVGKYSKIALRKGHLHYNYKKNTTKCMALSNSISYDIYSCVHLSDLDTKGLYVLFIRDHFHSFISS